MLITVICDDGAYYKEMEIIKLITVICDGGAYYNENRR